MQEKRGVTREGAVGSFEANRSEKHTVAFREAEEDQLGAGRGLREQDQFSGRHLLKVFRAGPSKKNHVCQGTDGGAWVIEV